MEDEEYKYKLIDHTVELDVSKLPKLFQNTIADLEKLDAEGDWVVYDNYAGGLESFAKSAVSAGAITESQYNKIIKKYRGGL